MELFHELLCADLHLFELGSLLVDVLLHHLDLFLLLHEFLDSILITQLLVIEVVSLLVEQGLEDMHQVKEARWSHVIIPRRIVQELLAQFARLKMEDLCCLDNLFFELIVERCLLHHLQCHGVQCLRWPLVEPVKRAAVH